MKTKQEESRQAQRLRKRVWEGLERRLGGDPGEFPVRELCLRAWDELDVINNMGLVDDFLMMSNIVNYARRHDIPIGTGRGSLPASAVAYALGITEVDPSRYGLIFERLVNPCFTIRNNADIDVCAQRKPEIIAYIERVYGQDKVQDCEASWEQANRSKNHKGFHISLKASADVTRKHHAARLVRQKKCPDFDLSDLPLGDQAAFDLIRSGDTADIFDLESDDKQRLVRRCAPKSIEELAVLCALGQPYNKGRARKFCRRRNGSEPVSYAHPLLEPILQETCGLIIYQEQFIRILVVLAGEPYGDAGFTLGQADYARRVISKGFSGDVLRQMQCFTYGCIRTGTLTESEACLYFDELLGVATRCFSKAHSIGSALMTYQCAYLKAHYPEEYDETRALEVY